MSGMETFWNISLATPVVWRLTRMVSSAYAGNGLKGFAGASAMARPQGEEFLGSRVLDVLYWIGVWMSAQTALWVACGFAGVLLNWFALSGIARLARRTKIPPIVSFRARRKPLQDVARDAEHTGAVQPCR